MTNNLLLYHGSTQIIKKPFLAGGKIDNDYGQGFYCTQDKNLAGEWACQKKTEGFGYINSYLLDTSDLKFLYLNNQKYSVMNWLNILIENRKVDDVQNEEALDFIKKNYALNLKPYDVIVGWRADDSYFSFARDFMNGSITVQILTKAMTLGKLGNQIVLKSEKAFEKLEFKEVFQAECSVYNPQFTQRDSAARSTYREIRKEMPNSKGILITDIIRNPEVLKEWERNLPLCADDCDR